MPKDKQLKVRVTAQELQEIQAKAKECGLTVSQYVIEKCVHNSQEELAHRAKMCTQKAKMCTHEGKMCTQIENSVYTSEKPAKVEHKPKPAPAAREWKPYDKKASAK